jgi:tRNA A58 N-methylase Trm61
MRIKANDLVFLLSKDESYLVKAEKKDFNTKSGIIKLKDLIGRKFGERIHNS